MARKIEQLLLLAGDYLQMFDKDIEWGNDLKSVGNLTEDELNSVAAAQASPALDSENAASKGPFRTNHM